PQLAEGVEGGTVVSILVSEGQQVTKDQPFMELETQKAVGSIPSPQSGTVTKIHVKEGTEVAVGQVLISIETESSVTAEPSGATTAPPTTRPASPQPTVSSVRPSRAKDPHPAAEAYRFESKSGIPPPAAPSIRKIARDLGINLTRVQGSQSGGRIALTDLRSYVQRLQQIAFEEGKESPGAAPQQAAGSVPSDAIDFSKWGPVRRERMSPLRRTVSQRMVQSWTTIPKINQFDDAEISELLALRKKYSPAYERKGARLTLTSFLLKVIADALKKHRRANASLDEAANEIVYKDYIHIGVAVDTEAGLIVPVIRDVDKKNLLELSQELNEMTEKARQRKLSLENLQGGSFTISNQGSIGGSHFTPIIYPPQVAILGVGQGQPKPVVVEGKVVIRTLLPLCLAYDHRVLDGADAVRFLKDIIGGLKSFSEADFKLK
ncbi:MAG TPA: dihydrolipoamide acetyltransferase family protein, partial [Candidatus Binatia bacterium]|nr:dihydrolipoamide acetyltransferase family protein [Candidatus Binatia bacterium]